MTVSRPMLWISAAFVAGMYLFAFFGATVACTVIFPIVVATLLYICRRRALFDGVVLILSVASFVSGIVYYGVYDDVKNKDMYPYVDCHVTVQGKVKEQAKITKNYMQVRVKVDTLILADKTEVATNELMQLTCFIDEKAPAHIPVLKRGDTILVDAVLSVPDEEMNADGFDYAAYLKTEGVFFQATGDTKTLSVTGHNAHPVLDGIYGVRERCASLIDGIFPAQESSVLKAYILGDDNDMDRETKNIFSASGLSHILAVSGSHVVVFLSVIMIFLTKLRVPKRWQLVLSAILVVAYVVFTGMSISAIRAGFVCFMSVLAQILFKRSDPMTALFEAGAFLALLNPASIMGASFLLSFSATLGILLFGGMLSDRFAFLYLSLEQGSRKQKIMCGISSGLAIGFSAQIFTIPVLIGLFQVFSTLSVIATLILTPLLSPLLAGGLLFCVLACINTTIAMPVAGFIYLLVKIMILVSKWFAVMPFSQISYGGLTPFFLLTYGCIIVLLLAFLQKKKHIYLTCLYALASLTLVYLYHSAVNYPITSCTFINVGQGDCAWINGPGNCDILIDAGGKEKDYSVAEKTVWPYLVRNGVDDIEYAVASHGHADHINGMFGLFELTKIKNLIVTADFGKTEEAKVLLEKAEEKGTCIIRLKHGETMCFANGLRLSALAPDDKMLAFLSDEENNISLLLKVEYGNNAFLFTGDLSEKAEGYLAAEYPNLLPATVMKAAHHGSKFANSENMLDAVSPKYVYIPVGENNYGHPDTSVLQRMKDRNITYYRADKQHDVTFYMNKTKICGIFCRTGE